ncbi:MAG: NAD(P)/FAD-dependent oxidoreductase [Candidatus Eremiobacter antarcticus]|nr:geranylgeranyl reductase family protein [Candidatus Eremiobacteraeota bacterium]MBC5807020.1 geranylgeranyl reductase family protein [Candidatus Eremiobacteraeota bacterium]
MTAADVVVAGAGPAGSAAAHVLASAGLQVLVLERARFPRDKSCGDGVTAHAVDILTGMGVSFDAFGRQAVKTYGGLIGAPNGDAFLAQAPPHNGKPPECWVVPRMVLDERIAQAAVRAGAQLRQGALVTGLVRRRGAVEGVEWSDGGGVNRTAARIVIGADGAHSAVAKALRVKNSPPRHLGYALRGYFADVRELSGELEIYYFDAGLLPGYGWIFPTGPDTANVGVGIYSGELKRSKRKLRDILSAFVTSVPRVTRQLQSARPTGKAVGWPLPVSSAHRRTTFDGAMLCGDAASLVDPLTGEGIYTALVSGRSAAHAAIEALKSGDTSSFALRAHDREWRAIAGGYLSSGRLLKNLAKSPVLMNLIVRRGRENGYYASRAIGYGLGTLDRRRALRSIVMRALFNPSFFRN